MQPTGQEDTEGTTTRTTTAGTTTAATAAMDVTTLGASTTGFTLPDGVALARHILADAPMGIGITDAKTFRILAVNEAVVQLLGYTREELQQMSFAEITHPEDLPREIEIAERLLRGEPGFDHLVKRYVRKDGGIVFAKVTASIVRDPEGAPLYGLGFIHPLPDATVADAAGAAASAAAPGGAPAAGVTTRLLVSRYRVLRLLGEGAGGATYLCSDLDLGRRVAVKEIHAEGARRELALREARMLASVRHPNVVSLHTVEQGERISFLVMEYVAGGSLADRLRQGPLHPDGARKLLRGVLRGLQALHDVHLVHRDLKPSNVLVDEDGEAKVADLGVAEAADAPPLVSAGSGTPLWMAPEQVLDHRADARTDIYAAGALLYACLAGESYVRSAVREGVPLEEAIVSRPAPLPLPSAPDWANAFLERALRKDPAARFGSANEALEALGPTP